jgi:hypothetical protein
MRKYGTSALRKRLTSSRHDHSFTWVSSAGEPMAHMNARENAAGEAAKIEIQFVVFLADSRSQRWRGAVRRQRPLGGRHEVGRPQGNSVW